MRRPRGACDGPPRHQQAQARRTASRATSSKLESIFRAAPTGIGVVVNRCFTEVNDRVCAMIGYTRDELLGRNSRCLYPSDDECEAVGREKYDQIRRTGIGTVETRWRRKDGAVIDVLLSSSPIDLDDWSAGVTFTALDITERKRMDGDQERLATQLVQAQKMESIGRLAGGVAHDFNNMLQAHPGQRRAWRWTSRPDSAAAPRAPGGDPARRPRGPAT